MENIARRIQVRCRSFPAALQLFPRWTIELYQDRFQGTHMAYALLCFACSGAVIERSGDSCSRICLLPVDLPLAGETALLAAMSVRGTKRKSFHAENLREG